MTLEATAQIKHLLEVAYEWQPYLFYVAMYFVIDFGYHVDTERNASKKDRYMSQLKEKTIKNLFLSTLMPVSFHF